jgi:hypothetical protein
LCARSGNDRGRDAEQRQSDHQRQPGAEPVRRLAAENDAGRGGDQIGIDSSLNALRAEDKVGPRARQGRHDCRAIGTNRQHRQTRRPQHRRGQAGGVVSLSNAIIPGQSFSVVSGSSFGPLTVANGSMGAGYGGTVASLTYQESVSFTQNGGVFVLDLLSSDALGIGFDSVTMAFWAKTKRARGPENRAKISPVMTASTTSR